MNSLSKESVNRLAVGEDGAGQRIDHYLVRLLKGVPKSHIYRILRSGEVRVNGKRVGPDCRLVRGDELRVPPIRVAPAKTAAPTGLADRLAARLPILFEDEAILVVDKPAGLAVHGGSGIAHGLIEQLRAARPAASFLELVHRLDRETSGILVVAKKRAALVEMHRALREGELDKRYLVLVRGPWRDQKRTVRLPLHKYATGDGERRVRVEHDGQAAETVFRTRKVWKVLEPPLALLEAELLTGRTHQIRVHLSHLGHPVAGDDKYGDFAWNRELARVGLKRMFLHASRLSFAHPLSGAPVVIESALPSSLIEFLERMGSTEEGRITG